MGGVEHSAWQTAQRCALAPMPSAANGFGRKRVLGNVFQDVYVHLFTTCHANCHQSRIVFLYRGQVSLPLPLKYNLPADQGQVNRMLRHHLRQSSDVGI